MISRPGFLVPAFSSRLLPRNHAGGYRPVEGGNIHADPIRGLPGPSRRFRIPDNSHTTPKNPPARRK
ncbi:hypothetical protein AJ78_08843, partial [Emergomyces pasteurianus Ep9510]